MATMDTMAGATVKNVEAMATMRMNIVILCKLPKASTLKLSVGTFVHAVSIRQERYAKMASETMSAVPKTMATICPVVNLTPYHLEAKDRAKMIMTPPKITASSVLRPSLAMMSSAALIAPSKVPICSGAEDGGVDRVVDLISATAGEVSTDSSTPALAKNVVAAMGEDRVLESAVAAAADSAADVTGKNASILTEAAVMTRVAPVVEERPAAVARAVRMLARLSGV